MFTIVIDFIVQNYKMRQVLIQDGRMIGPRFVGVIGPKNNGKSMLVKKLTDKNTGANPTIETTTMTAYPVPDCEYALSTLIDYPPLESCNQNYGFQFHFSRLFLTSVIFVYDATKIGETMTPAFFDYLSLVKEKHDGRFVIVFTMVDELVCDGIDGLMEDFYLEIPVIQANTKNIIWTSLTEKGADKLADIIQNTKLNLCVRDEFKEHVLYQNNLIQ